MPRSPPHVPPLPCARSLCEAYLKTLKLPDGYFERKYDKCFCKACHKPSGGTTRCGKGCKQLHDWVRFGLKIHQAHQKQWNISKTWTTSYYGTSANLLLPILTNRFILFDGDRLDDGSTFDSGHPKSGHCVTFPSLVHASERKFSPRVRYRGTDGKNYDVQVVLQCKQKPDTFSVEGNASSFHSIEWRTGTRSCLTPSGILLKLHNV